MFEPDTEIDRNAETSTRRIHFRPAVIVSVLFHLAVIALLWIWLVPTPKRSGESGDLASSDGGRDAVNAQRESPSQPNANAPAPARQVPPEQIEASIESQITAAQSLSVERKLSELEKNLSRLQSVSSEQSVREVTETIAGASI